MIKDNKEVVYYHGTSTVFDVGEYLLPTTKLPKEKIRTTYRKNTAKVYVTASIDAAKFYAARESEEKGGDPIIYIVKPDAFSMIKINKTDFATSNAKIIGVFKE